MWVVTVAELWSNLPSCYLFIRSWPFYNFNESSFYMHALCGPGFYHRLLRADQADCSSCAHFHGSWPLGQFQCAPAWECKLTSWWHWEDNINLIRTVIDVMMCIYSIQRDHEHQTNSSGAALKMQSKELLTLSRPTADLILVASYTLEPIPAG